MKEETNLQLKRTPLYPLHKKNYAKMVIFFNWEMPIEYEGILREAKNTRTHCTLFDVSHMGKIEIKGKKSLKFIQYLTTNNIERIKAFSLQYNLFINEEATIIDDFMIYKLEDGFLCVVNASNKDKVFRWLNSNKIDGVEIEDKSDDMALLSLQGPHSEAVIKKISSINVKRLKYMHFIYSKIDGVRCIISRSGYTGEDGFELYCSSKDAFNLWELITNGGKEYFLSFGGLGARDILRIEAGYPLYGHEINESINPIEASLRWVVKEREKDFMGREKILKIMNSFLSKKRIGFIMEDKGIARQDYCIYSKDKKNIGKVTSGTYSPNLNKFIGMGYIDGSYSDKQVYIEIRKKLYRAKIESFPFINIRTR